MKKIGILALVLIAAVIALVYEKPEQVDDTHYTYSDGTIMIAGRSISFEMAVEGSDQNKGLSGRPGLEENQSMLFVFPRADFPVFWMKDMNFPIDIVWLKGAEVVDITQNAEPQPGVADKDLKTFAPSKPADKVLELKAGWASRNGLKIGDMVEVTQVIK